LTDYTLAKSYTSRRWFVTYSAWGDWSFGGNTTRIFRTKREAQAFIKADHARHRRWEKKRQREWELFTGI
jgi:hypothetical protein